MIRRDVGHAREICAKHHDYRRRLGELVVLFEPDTKLHSKYVPTYTPRGGYEAAKYMRQAALIGQMRASARIR
jgi:hypothetical protein